MRVRRPTAAAAGMLRDGPVLLVPTCGALPASVATELDRLAATEVVALGGTGAVCPRLLRRRRPDVRPAV